MTNRRRALGAMAAGAVALATQGRATAQTQAGRVVRIVVPYAAGGGTDILARHLAEAIGPELGANVIVENRAGGSGNIGAAAVAKATPDGTTLLMGDLALAGSPIKGRYVGSRAGHAMTNRLLRALFARPDAYRVISCTAEDRRLLPGAGVSRGDIPAVA